MQGFLFSGYEKPQDEPVTFANMASVLKELYDYVYLDEEAAFMRLVERYWKLLPYVKIKKYNQIKGNKAAKDRASELWKGLVYNRNPFLESCMDRKS